MRLRLMGNPSWSDVSRAAAQRRRKGGSSSYCSYARWAVNWVGLDWDRAGESTAGRMNLAMVGQP